MSSTPLQIHTLSASERGLSSVTTLVVGAQAAVLFDPPFLIPDANNVVAWIKEKTDKPLKALFVTHHHPDHYFSANPILEANPGASLYAAPYVCDGINAQYDDKMTHWPKVFGPENVPERPTKPTPFTYSFLSLEGNPDSPIFLLGPLQGDCVNHTLFWMPREKALICGDSVYARSTHVWVEELDNEALLKAWNKTLDLIESLDPEILVTGHLENGWELDAKKDLAHTREYLKLFAEKVAYAPKKPSVDELYQTFKDAFPKADKNLEFFLGHLSNQFGEGGKIWDENRHRDNALKTQAELEGYLITVK